MGHNSNLTAEEQRKLSGYVSEIMGYESEIKAINEAKSEVYATLKENGFDTKAVRHVVKLRKMDREERDSLENAIDAYKLALGMLAGTPLGEAAVQRDVGMAPAAA